MKTILLPTDFSKCAAYGLEFAANLARKNKSKLYLYNTALTTNYYYSGDSFVITPPAGIMMLGINENLKKASMKKLQALKKKKILKGINVTVDCDASPNIYYSILDYADKIKAGVIIMGTRGSSGVKGILLGSTAERVVRFSSRPVIVIPGRIKNTKRKLIIFASDFSREAYGIFPVVQNFAKIYGAEIRLLKVNTMDQFTRTRDDLSRINDFNKRFGGKYKTAVCSDYMKEEGILNYADEVKADLIAIGTHGKKGLRRFFSEDVSEGIVRLSQKPILVVNLRKFKHKSDLY